MGAQRTRGKTSSTAQGPATGGVGTPAAVSADVLRLSRELRRARQDAARYRRRWSVLRDGLRRLLELDIDDGDRIDVDSEAS